VSHFVPWPLQRLEAQYFAGAQKKAKKNFPATPVPFCLILHGDFQGQHTKTGKKQHKSGIKAASAQFFDILVNNRQ
jgi:hypothetical protein